MQRRKNALAPDPTEEAIRRAGSIGALEQLAGIGAGRMNARPFGSLTAGCKRCRRVGCGCCRVEASHPRACRAGAETPPNQRDPHAEAHSPAMRPETCLFCGEVERVEIFEVWATNSCSRRAARACMRSSLLKWLRILHGRDTYSVNCARKSFCGYALRRVADDGCCGLLLDWQLEIRPIDRGICQALCARHHAHCRPPLILAFPHRDLQRAHAFRRRDRWKSSRASTERARDCRSQSALHPAGHRCSAPLECLPQCSMAGAREKPLGRDGKKSLPTHGSMRWARRCEHRAGRRKAAYAAAAGTARAGRDPIRTAGSARCVGASHSLGNSKENRRS